MFLTLASQTVKHYRRAVLPLPKSLTPYLDKLRKLRSSDYVFVNSRGQPYSTSAFLFSHCFVSAQLIVFVPQPHGRTLSSRRSPSSAAIGRRRRALR